MNSTNSKPRGEIRIIYNSDGNAVDFFPFEPSSKEDFYTFVDNLAANGVNLYVQDVFWAGLSYYNSKFCDRVALKDARRHDEKLEAAFALGLEPVEIWAERSHEKGMKFSAAFRMNDEHSGGNLKDPYRASMMGSFLKENSHLWLKQHPGALDYSHDGVREYMFSVLQEVVERFDVDGLELIYIRHEHCFPTDTAREMQPVMIGFLKRVRGMLDTAGKKKGRRLLLGVMVPQTLEECHALGYDIPTWVKEELIDYVAPADFFYTDFNARYEEFAAFTRNSNCMLFPTMHPKVCAGNNMWLMSLENYRAAARNIYDAGADGIETFNYMYHWARMHGNYTGAAIGYPLALSWLRELRHPERLGEGGRHYLFYPLYSTASTCPTGFVKNEHILLKREVGSYGEYRFRIAEDLSLPGVRAQIYITARELRPKDKVEISINGTTVAGKKIMNIWKPDGRPEKYGRALGPHTGLMWPLTSPPTRWGDNILGVKLTVLDSEAKEDIVIDEVEVTVLPPWKDG